MALRLSLLTIAVVGMIALMVVSLIQDNTWLLVPAIILGLLIEVFR